MTELMLDIRRRLGDGLCCVDRLCVAVAATLVALAFAALAEAEASFAFTLRALVETAPWLLLSIRIAAYVGTTGADRLIARAFKGRLAATIALAALTGALSPFCSCGVIPLIAALISMGVPLAPVTAFWLVSPVMDPAMFALTVGTLGLEFAAAKTLAAVGIGLLALVKRRVLAPYLGFALAGSSAAGLLFQAAP